MTRRQAKLAVHVSRATVNGQQAFVATVVAKQCQAVFTSEDRLHAFKQASQWAFEKLS